MPTISPGSSTDSIGSSDARTTLRASDDPDNDPEAEDRRRGTGLGLAIARWIARTHGGEIAVSSVVGQGSVFEVILPLPD